MSDEIPPEVVEEFRRLMQVLDIEASIQRTPYGYLLKLPPAFKEVTLNVTAGDERAGS